MDDYELDFETVCPACGHAPVHRRECHCEDGWVWGYDEDPLWYDPDEFIACTDCDGVGFELWCPSCGADLTSRKWMPVVEAQWAESCDAEMRMMDALYGKEVVKAAREP